MTLTHRRSFVDSPIAVGAGPCGGDARNVIEGDLRLGIADGTENYVPLGQPDVLEHPQPGEVIYYDTATKDVFCRAWCWKNGNRRL